MFNDFYENLKKELRKELPGKKAQIKMSPDRRNHLSTEEKCRNAGVLILLYPKNEELYLVFIRRTEYNGPHSGQISFPGGKSEESDKDIVHTALRESHEEVGINMEKVEILGQLSPLHIPVSNFIVYPSIGMYTNVPKFKPDPEEVEEIIEVKLNELLNPNNCTKKEFKYGDLSFYAPIYNPNNIIIWGATAMILSELIEILRSNTFKFQE